MYFLWVDVKSLCLLYPCIYQVTAFIDFMWSLIEIGYDFAQTMLPSDFFHILSSIKLQYVG